MSRAAVSIMAWGVYLMVAGLGFYLIPNLLLPIFGFAPTTEVWIRVLGLLSAVLGVIFFYCGRNEVVPFFRISVVARFGFAIGVVVLVILGLAAVPLLLFGALDAIGGTWTWLALQTPTRG